MARKTKAQVIRAFRNDSILQAALKVFAAHGVGASVEEIARLAGVAKGTIYLYYPSKQAIYRAALREGLIALGAQLRCRVEAAPTLREKIRAFIETKIAFFAGHHDFCRIYLAAFGDLTHPLCHKEFKAVYVEQLGLLTTALREGSRAEGVHLDRPEAAALAIYDLTRGALARRLLESPRQETERDVDFLLDLIWKGLAH